MLQNLAVSLKQKGNREVNREVDKKNDGGGYLQCDCSVGKSGDRQDLLELHVATHHLFVHCP